MSLKKIFGIVAGLAVMAGATIVIKKALDWKKECDDIADHLYDFPFEPQWHWTMYGTTDVDRPLGPLN